MLSPIRRDHIAGCLAGALGLGVLFEARQYEVGTLAHVGPGFMPMILGALLILCGAGIFMGAAASPAANPVAPGPKAGAGTPWGGPDLRGGACIIGSVILFVVLATYSGLVPATFCCVLCAAMGDRQAKPGQSLLLAAGITLFGVAVFYFGLHVQLPLFWKS